MELPGLVEQLLVAVKGTNDFEGELAHQFSGQASDAPPEVCLSNGRAHMPKKKKEKKKWVLKTPHHEHVTRT